LIGGRKKKAVHKTTTTDDKRLQSTLKRIGVNSIPGIEEVNIFKDDVVIQFVNPKGMILWTPVLNKISTSLISKNILWVPLQCKRQLVLIHGWSVELHRQRVCSHDLHYLLN
jgi:hypothetical protein